MPSDLYHLSHVHYHPTEDYPALSKFAVMEKRPRLLLPLNRPDVPHLATKLTDSASKAVRLAWSTDHDHILFGPSGKLRNKRFRSYEAAWNQEEVEHEVVARKTYLGVNAEEVAGRFQKDVAEGRVVLSVRGGKTGAVDVDLGEKQAGPPSRADRSMPLRPASEALPPIEEAP